MLIGLSGKARSGKDTLGDYLVNILASKDEQYTLMAYADELKRKVAEDFNLSNEQLYGDLKEAPDNRYGKESGRFSSNPVEAFWSPREILQFMGTDVYRAIDDNFWVRKLFDKIDKMNYSNVIVTDLRLPNEVEAINDRDGIHIRVIRPGDNKINGQQHISETALDDTKADIVVYNEGTLEDLYDTAIVSLRIITQPA